MITQIENKLIQKNRDKLLRILLEKEYKRYSINTHLDNTYPENFDFNGNRKYVVLDFYEWLEKILQDF